MCHDVVRSDPYSLQFVSDWFVTEEQIDVWYYDVEYYDNDELIEWYNNYHRQKAPKSKIKKEILPIAWHPDRVKDWYMSEDEKGLWN